MKNTLNSSASCFQFHAALTNIQKSEITIIRFEVGHSAFRVSDPVVVCGLVGL